MPPVQLGDRDRLKRRIYAKNPDCHWCGRRMRIVALVRGARADGDMATFEHIVPECRGGVRDESNMVLACFRCNGLRGDYPTLCDALRAHIDAAQARVDRLQECPIDIQKLALRSVKRKLAEHRLLLDSITDMAA